MAITKEKKKEIVEKLKNILAKSKSVVFVNFHGLKVSEITDIRRKLREENNGYFVAKKTLVKRVLEESKVPGDTPSLDGELALVYGEDSISPAREIYSFQKKFKENLQILGGIFEGKFKNMEEMTELAKIPSMDALRGMFLNVIHSPIQGLAIALSEIAKKKEN